MSSIAYNLSRKLEWMVRRLRRSDDAGDIKDWIDAMTSINRLLKETGNHYKVYRDDWRPWQQGKNRRKGLKMKIDEDKTANGVKKNHEQLMPPLGVSHYEETYRFARADEGQENVQRKNRDKGRD